VLDDLRQVIFAHLLHATDPDDRVDDMDGASNEEQQVN
jgi:hypothetical protein